MGGLRAKGVFVIRDIVGSFMVRLACHIIGGDARPKVDARVSCGVGAKEPEAGTAGAGSGRA